MNFKHIDKFFMMIKYIIKILILILEMKFYVVCMGTIFICDYTYVSRINVILSLYIILLEVFNVYLL